MSNGFLSQEEIDSLLNGGESSDAGSAAEESVPEIVDLTHMPAVAEAFSVQIH